ncbi:dynamin family protein [Schinkia sp. CFF1]
MTTKRAKKLSISKVMEDMNDFSNVRRPVLWNSTSDRYAYMLERVQRLMKEDAVQDLLDSNILSKMGSFITQCREPEFHVAIIGVVKAGKSTLINALLGKQLASTAVTPETAVLTKFRSGRGKNFVKISFYNSSEWKMLWDSVKENPLSTFMKEYTMLNAESVRQLWINKENVYLEPENDDELERTIKEWTSSQDPKHYFVKEVEVGVADFNLPEQVVFVDTPGLNDVVRYRSDVTRNYINRANAVILCALSKTLNTGDLQTMYNVFANCRENPGKVYTLGTQIDLLNEPETDWKRLKNKWISYLEGTDCYGSTELAKKNIFGISAHLFNQAISYPHLTIRERKKLENSLFDFESPMEDIIGEAKQYSKIEIFRETLFNEIVYKHEQLLIQELKSRFESLQNELVELFLYIKKSQSDILQTANQDLEKIIKAAKEKEIEVKELQDNQKGLQDVLFTMQKNNVAYIKELKKQTTKLV